jgi:NADPH:quinone reductase-like Zn-dependent oxidoreductase
MTPADASTSSAAREGVSGGPFPPGVLAVEVVLPGLVEPNGLQVRTRELTPPGRGEALVAVDASGVSFAEQSMRRGRYPGQPRFPFVPGYDVVGTVTATGIGVDPALVGQRVAAITKTGGWASHVVLSARDLLPVTEGLDPAEVETLVVNGITAWQMLHRTAKVQPGQVILVHGANGGVGTTLAQLARHHGVRVIGAAHPRHHPSLRLLGVEPVDYADPAAMDARVGALAPGGVDAVFDNLGGPTLLRSWRLLAPGGALVSYSIASVTSGNLIWAFLRLLVRLAAWNVAPNGKRAVFYDIWAGRRTRPRTFRTRLRTDFGLILDLLSTGVLTPQVAARIPLAEAAEAMVVAESRTAIGKVVLVP